MELSTSSDGASSFGKTSISFGQELELRKLISANPRSVNSMVWSTIHQVNRIDKNPRPEWNRHSTNILWINLHIGCASEPSSNAYDRRPEIRLPDPFPSVFSYWFCLCTAACKPTTTVAESRELLPFSSHYGIVALDVRRSTQWMKDKPLTIIVHGWRWYLQGLL